ncbi:DUF1294 domain-containing protein [Pseudoalteromonas luteoviolacea]|nr:DUF1294 domain-containing protein [Pseudoalteromonas luteoviolacea]
MVVKSFIMFLAKCGVIVSLCTLGVLILPLIAQDSSVLGAVLGGLIVSNLLMLIVFYKDKAYAKQNKERVSERTLVLLSALALHCSTHLVMHFTHHKTNKVSFQLKLLLAISIQVLVSTIWFVQVYI